MTFPYSIPFAPQDAAPPTPPGRTPDYEVQVRVPEEVDLALPKAPVEEIAVPASINGRDLSLGQP